MSELIRRCSDAGARLLRASFGGLAIPMSRYNLSFAGDQQTGAASTSSSPTFSAQYQRAVDLYEAKSWAKCVALLDRIAPEAPIRLRRNVYRLRITAWGNGLDQPARALQLCEDGLDEFPDWQEGWVLAGRFQAKHGAQVAAFRSYKRAIRLGDTNGTAAYAAFVLLMNRQRYRAAARLLPLVEPHSERFQGFREQRAELYLALGSPDLALTLLDEYEARIGTSNHVASLRKLALSQKANFSRPRLRPGLRHVAIGGASFVGSTVFGMLLGSLDGFANIGESHWLTQPLGRSNGVAAPINFGPGPPRRWLHCRVCGADCPVLTPEFRARLAADPVGWYDQIAEHMKTDFLVSSDKAVGTYRRLEPGFDFDLVILYRSPADHFRSHKRITAARAARQIHLHEPWRDMSNVLQSWQSNYAGLLRTIRPRGRRVLLSWDNFVARPAEHFDRVLEILGLPGNRDQFGCIRPGHFIGGSMTAGAQETLRSGIFIPRPSTSPPLSSEEMAAILADEASQSLFRRMQNEHRRDFGDLSPDVPMAVGPD